MLSLFPDLFLYSMLAPFILRVVAGLLFIDLGTLVFKSEKARWTNSFVSLGLPNPVVWVKILGAIEILGGILLFIGLYTQAAALVLAVITLFEIIVEYKDPQILKRGFSFYFLLLAITLSLLLSGAGAFAFDLPL